MRFFHYFLLTIIFLFPPTASQADLKVCNDTLNLSGVAVGYHENNVWTSSGWWHIPSGECSAVIPGDLEHKDYYLFAEDRATSEIWSGETFLCTSNIEFSITGNEDCYARGFEKSGFFKVSTNQNINWQVRLQEHTKNE